MNSIIFPLRPNMQGLQVMDLQDALSLFLDRSVIQVSAAAPNTYKQQLLSERGVYGTGTRTVVSMYQQQRGISPIGEVDERTATSMNTILSQLGMLTNSTTTVQEWLVGGQILYTSGQPFAGVRVRAFHVTQSNTLRLGEDTTDANGRYTIHFSPLPAGQTLQLRIAVMDADNKSLAESAVTTTVNPLQTINVNVSAAQAPGSQRRIEGRVVFDHGLPAEQVKLRLYQRDFNGAETMLGETVTREQGLYTLPYTATGSPSLQVRTVNANNQEVALSQTLYNLGEAEKSVVSLVAPAALQPAATEYQRLVTDLLPHISTINALSQVREDEDRQDLTLLNRKTGWDARLLALAATSSQISTDTSTGLSHDVLYGLFRAGLPTDKLQLATVSTNAAEKALLKARESGIISLTDQQLATAKTSFANFSRATRLKTTAPGAVSTYESLLTATGLNQATRDKFATVYLEHRGDGPQLWEKLRTAGMAENDIQTLQRQGKLAYLAMNNAALTTRLQQTAGIKEPVELVDKGFYHADQWKTELKALANNNEQQLLALIPDAFQGANVEERLNNYAGDMARKVRLSYPTQVVRHMLETDTTDAFKLGAGRPATVTFLKNASTKGFKLGEMKLDTFVKDHPEVLDGISENDRTSAKQQVKLLQRIYQITPGNEAMKTLMGLGFKSAADVVAISYHDFIGRYGSYFPAPEQARLVYRKAEQINAVTFNLFTMAKKLDGDPPIKAISPPAAVKETTKQELIKQFPTMETLFGSLDYCECEHCRSVLSPAAYLVDLLQLLDTQDPTWSNFLSDWKKKHSDQEYAAKYKHPYEALIERRPDLPNISLSCENTNTVLPYIDIVNEILEYYVANNTLKAEAANDTGTAATADLLAEPQHIITAAYDILSQTRYPLTLPFDLWLETVRRFCDYFETPLWQILEVFRPGDELFSQTQTYDYAAIYSEFLQLSPGEYAMLTNPSPLEKWYELYGYTSAAEATTVAVDADTQQRIDLHSAKALSRRLGISYKELAAVVRTGFVNPDLEALIILNKLDVSVHAVLFYEQQRQLLTRDENTLSADEKKKLYEVKAFEQRMDDLSKQFASSGLNVKEWMNTALQNKAFKNILILADPDTGCNFDETTFRYADARAADDIAFLKVNFFVRIWRKLGWTIEETDRALQVFTPKNTPFDAAHLNRSPLKTALLYLAHLKALDEQLHLGGQNRLVLPVIWSKMATTGSNPLYARLFLAPGVLKQDAVFDDPLGNYLSAAGTLLKDHLPALQGALELTADDIAAILTDNQQSIDTAVLTLEQVSLLYRYGLLARALNSSIPELIVLKQLSGLNPFKPLDADPVTTLSEDYPLTQTLQFVKIAAQVKSSGLKTEDLDYLLRHRFDPAGKYHTSAESSLLLMKQLADGITRIRSEHGIPGQQTIINEETLRQKLGLGLPPDATDRLLAMIKGTAVFTATISGVAPADQLQLAAFEKEPAIIQVSYNETRQEQQIAFRGVLMEDRKGKLKTAFPSPVLAALLDKVQAQAYDFFINHFRKQALKSEDAAGFFDSNDFITLFTPLVYVKEGDTPEEIAEKQNTNEYLLQQRYKRVAEAYYPFLQRRLIRQFTVQTLASQTGADAALVELLLTDLPLPSIARPLLEALTSAGDDGLNADFFPTADGSGTALARQVLADVNTASKPAGANSARFQGYITVPTNGAYRFYIPLAKSMSAHLRFDHLAGPLLTGNAGVNGIEVSTYTELKAGTLYHFTLDLQNLSNGDGRLLVQSELLPKGPLTQLRCYPHQSITQAEQAVILLTKVLQWIQQFRLTEREVRYLLANTADFDDLDLSQLPVNAKDSTPAKASVFFKQLLRMIDYTRARIDMAGDTDGLISIFEAASIDEAYTAIAQLTRRDALTVKLAATAIFTAPAFKNERSLLRIWDALKITAQVGVAVPTIAGWTRIVSSATTPAQRFAIARDVKESLKARFEAEAWQRIAQSVFDKLRRRQRDALVAYVMQQHGFSRADQLYEYFLIDPAMEPVVQTSRIRLAISSVQLFIQRCLLNLEIQVPPAVINTEQWEWMKQYRVWEANRKIFLFPENWLEPEFRDDKTHLYNELESELLQGDIDNDIAEDAFLNYLKKLEELARLEMVGMYCEDNADPALNVLHVIGRTHNDPYKYFYRRYAHQMWTPWEPVNAEITGDHIAPVIWRDRLYLFWVTFMDKPDFDAAQAANTPSNGAATALRATNFAAIAQYQQPEKQITDLTLSQLSGGVKNSITSKIVVALLHWSEYIRGEWSTSASGGINVALAASAPFNFTPNSVFIHVAKSYDNNEERGVNIHLGSPFNKAFYLEGRNSPPYAVGHLKEPAMPYSNTGVQATRYVGSGALNVTYKRRITQQDGQAAVAAAETSGILQKGNSYTLLPCDNDISLADAEIASLVKPFFYQDNKEQTFFIEPELTEKTIEEWQEWVTNTPVPEPEWELPDWWKTFPLTPTVPKPKPYIAVNPQDPVWKFQPDVAAAYQVRPDNDWLTNPATALHYGDALVGPIGRANVRIQPLATLANVANSSTIPVNIQAGSQVLADSTVVTTDHKALEIAGLAAQSTTPLAVVGNSGLNSTIRNNVQVFNTNINIAKTIQFMNIK